MNSALILSNPPFRCPEKASPLRRPTLEALYSAGLGTFQDSNLQAIPPIDSKLSRIFQLTVSYRVRWKTM